MARQNHLWLFFNASACLKTNAIFHWQIEFLKVASLSCSSGVSRGTGVCKIRLMGKLLHTPKCPVTTYLCIIYGESAKSHFWTSLPRGYQVFYSHGKTDLLNLTLAGTPSFQQHRVLLRRKLPAHERSNPWVACSFARGTTCTRGVPARKSHRYWGSHSFTPSCLGRGLEHRAGLSLGL